ncbi:uncharacterized protein LOC124718100 [Schistocerca piceifrons]|uniref:uncharacterized protein LOC124718100 n=1 Tax=Schistocerca piceifrons TaxID=274613 RepID=UPI001F5ECF36|nr:uncharacterized protein LOC124718100 [Schistocerca piceifrons]
MTGRVKGFVGKVCEVNPSLRTEHRLSNCVTLVATLSQNKNIVTSINNIQGFINKLNLWIKTIKNGSNLAWIRDPFVDSKNIPINLDLGLQIELTDLKADRALESTFSKFLRIWLSIGCEYSAISEKALNVLPAFSTTYLCELSFSMLTEIKTSERERERDLNPSVMKWKISPQISCQYSYDIEGLTMLVVA